jgi:hypothetical protein
MPTNISLDADFRHVWYTDDHMTNALEEAIERAQALPEVEQDLVGEMVLAYMEGDRRTYRLTPEQVAEVKLAQAEVRKGKIATEEEVRNLWDSFLQA